MPPTVVKEVENLAKKEHRTKSELFREMVRVYGRYSAQQERDEDRWIANLIVEAKAEEARSPMSAEERLAEDERLTRYGAQQAKRLGLKTDMRSINRIIHERRKARRA